MTDHPLNPESVKAALCAFHGVPNDGSSWGVESCPIGAFNMIAAIRAYLAAEAERGWAMRPREATVAMLQDGHHAARGVVRGGACGMTIEAQVRHEAARENAAWTAMWDAPAKDPAHD